jgi:hypothetical protein
MSNRIIDEFGSILNSTFRNRDYYFHPDEDFREDREWAKNKAKLPKEDVFNKKSLDEVSL